ncbi:NUDIX domain-containing protein [Streptomyces lydicus]|uniref:NUDIX domain-containing protein n=1 Tax=Streptomyces lydicus TaxID=47763 RepID=UPI0037BB9D51
MPRKRVAAGVLFFDEVGRVMLVDPIYKEPWEIPGGAVEAGESPHLAACREVKEELGIAPAVGRLLGLDWTAPRPERSEGLVTIFDGGQLPLKELQSIQLPADEIRSFDFVPVDELETRLIPLLARRVRACVKARKQSLTVYMENGYPAI